LDYSTNTVWLETGESKKEEIALTHKEFLLLEYFMRHPNQIVTRDQLLAQLWEWDAEPTSSVVAAQMRLLRRKLAQSGCEDLVEEFAALALAANVKLTADLPSSHSIVTRGNPQQLYRLVSNLMVNAIHYTPSGGEVKLSLRRNETEVVLQVKDTGIGIAPKEQQRIFDRFYRVDQGRDRHTGGAGLGLAIAQAIAHAHQGSICVDSTMGQGSIFTVKLHG
jgi:signal transduction histidine kinase